MKPLIFTLLMISQVVLSSVFADKPQHEHHREHEAHVHGHVSMNMVLDGRQLLIEIESPAANIVGFEHQPSTHEQRDAVSKVIENLKKAGEHFSFPQAAQCELVSADIESELIAVQHGHDQHAHEKKVHGQQEAVHSEFEMTYAFTCSQPEKLDYIEVLLSKTYPGIERILVQYLTPAGQGGTELEEDSIRIKF
jgi:hypothetical protein